MTNPFLDTPFRMAHVQTQVALITAEASSVIWMRMMGWSGLWSRHPDENLRMITEKQRAFYQSGSKILNGAAKGQDGLLTFSQGLKPIRTATRSNVRRLKKDGPRS